MALALHDAAHTGVSLAGVMDRMGRSHKGSRLPVTGGVYGQFTEGTYEAAWGG